jgi:hypothetical protein
MDDDAQQALSAANQIIVHIARLEVALDKMTTDRDFWRDQYGLEYGDAHE